MPWPYDEGEEEEEEEEECVRTTMRTAVPRFRTDDVYANKQALSDTLEVWRMHHAYKEKVQYSGPNRVAMRCTVPDCAYKLTA